MSTNRGDMPANACNIYDFLPSTGEQVVRESHEGMTIREQMAMAAMQGLCANSIPGAQNRPVNLAAEAVMHADALLAQLERTK